MKKLLAILTAVLALAPFAGAQENNKVIFAYFSGYRCPPCMQFKLEYLNDFKQTYREKYNGRVEFVEYMTDIPLGLDEKSPEYKTEKESADRNKNLLKELGLYHKLNYIGSIPVAVIGQSVMDGSAPDKELNKENVEAAIDKALKNNETTKLAFKHLSGKKEDYKDINEAVQAQDLKAVKSFLKSGSDANAGDWPPLNAAAFNGDTDMIKLLLDNRAKVNASAGGYTALYQAAQFGRVEAVRLLLSKRADIYAGKGAFAAAAAGTDRYIIKMLKNEYNADINRRLENGETPLMSVVSTRDDGKGGARTQMAINSAGILIDEGADVNLSNGGKTVLQYAKSDKMRDFLISKGAK